MIRDLADLTLSNGLGLVYGAVAAAVAAGALLGVAVVLITAAARAGE